MFNYSRTILSHYAFITCFPVCVWLGECRARFKIGEKIRETHVKTRDVVKSTLLYYKLTIKMH